MEKGWKPMPVILKIIWIIQIVTAFFALLQIGGIYNVGFEFMGFSLYGLYALNVFFIFKIVIPVFVIIGIHQRYRFIWIAAVSYFVLMAVNGFACIGIIDELQNKLLDKMPEIPEGVSEEMYYLAMKWTIILSLVMGSLFNLAITILIFIKRKYFLAVKHLDPPAESELPE